MKRTLLLIAVSLLLLTAGCSTGKAIGGLISGIGEDVSGLATAVEDHQRK